ncbi:hypothetical protein BM1_08899 [Bipolaris maydis]|nr:hypothetical protein BM1_08899 [Bipolaris maydis]
MHFTTPLFLLVASATASPLLGINIGGLSVGVAVSSRLIDLSLATTSSSVVATSTKATTTTPTKTPTTTGTSQLTMPSSFSAPVQGQGILTLDNLPALPAVIDKSLSGVLGSVYGLRSIQSLLVDGDKYTMNSTISAWCEQGRCYGSADIPLTATAPFVITCDHLTGGNSACSATISGAAQAIFTNGRQVELWGWLTPAGYCKDGICVASISAFGDPMY